MDSASLQFVLFGLAAAIVSNFSRARAWRSIVLFVATTVFLALLARSVFVLLPLLGFLLLGYAFLLLLRRGSADALSWMVTAVVLVYIWLKKYTFLPGAITLHSAYLSLGLSYVFFRVLQLLIETGHDRENGRLSFGAYLLYTLNFTTFLSGPIQRYDAFARDQFAEEPLPLGARVVGLQLERIVRGFFKVNVLGMLLNSVRVDALAQMYQPLSAHDKFTPALQMVIVYPLFLYANFSGYIDIVMGIARLMRLRLPENFDRPFAASSVIDFWSRWHITLSNWLKSYVFTPLLVTLMRRITSVAIEPLLAVFCFFVTFFLIGLWHGRTSEFIFFGVLTGGGMSINKLWQLGLARAMGRKGYKQLATRPWYLAWGRGLNFVWFAFTLFWFWSNWKELHAIWAALLPAEWLGVWVTAFLIVTIALAAWEWLRAALLSIKTAEGPVLTSRYALVVYWSVMGLAAVIVTVLLNLAAPPIVYKAF